MKILFASMPADGHFNPLTGVAAHLRQRGHDVRWYAGRRYGRKLETLDMPWYPYRDATEITGENIHELFPERATLRGTKRLSFDLEKFFVANVHNHYRDIATIRDTFAFDVFFCDGAVYAEKLVAERLGVPVFAVGISTVIPDADGPPPFFGLRPANTIIGKTVHRVVRAMLARTMKEGVRAYNETLAAEGIAPIARDGFPHAPMSCARRVFLNGSPGLEFPHYQPPANAEFVGALMPVRGVLGPDVPLPLAIIDPATTVVAVSQGTVDNADPSKLIIPALEGLKDGPYVVVVTTGGGQTPELRQRFARPNVVIEDFINFDDLFSHVDVFVTNGGYGSVLAAMRHGVPVVGAGTREGKNDINARIAYNRLGVDLRSERPKPSRIAAAVRHVLDATQIKANIARVRAELNSYDSMAIIETALHAEPLSAHP